MDTYREDFATMVDTYFLRGKILRQNVRELIQNGKFELAVKYLFVKYIVFEDSDGKIYEYEIYDDSLPLTIDEVEALMKKFKDQIPSYVIESFDRIKEIVDSGKNIMLNKNIGQSLGIFGLSKSILDKNI